MIPESPANEINGAIGWMAPAIAVLDPRAWGVGRVVYREHSGVAENRFIHFGAANLAPKPPRNGAAQVVNFFLGHPAKLPHSSGAAKRHDGLHKPTSLPTADL